MDTLNITCNCTQEPTNATDMDAYSNLYLILSIAEKVVRPIAVITNILVVVTISASIKHWRYSMGTLMLTLALCDTVLNAIRFFYLLSRFVFYSHWFTKVLFYILRSLEGWSKLLMLAFSVNRYALVCKPFSHHWITSRKSTFILTITLAVIAFTTNIPWIIPWRMADRIYKICKLIKGSVTFFVPLIVTFVLTVLVICELNRNRGTLGVSSESIGARQGERNITKAMVVTLMAYILLVLPYYISTAVPLKLQLKFALLEPLFTIFAFLYLLNFSINIFIYTLYLPKFRSTLFKFLKCKCCKRDESVGLPAAQLVQFR